jgi:thioredoxin-like negative regulator of GroEL
MKPIVTEAAHEAHASLSVCIATAGDPILNKYNVRSVPTLIKFDGDTEVDRLVGKQTTEAITKFFH